MLNFTKINNLQANELRLFKHLKNNRLKMSLAVRYLSQAYKAWYPREKRKHIRWTTNWCSSIEFHLISTFTRLQLFICQIHLLCAKWAFFFSLGRHGSSNWYLESREAEKGENIITNYQVKNVITKIRLRPPGYTCTLMQDIHHRKKCKSLDIEISKPIKQHCILFPTKWLDELQSMP